MKHNESGYALRLSLTICVVLWSVALAKAATPRGVDLAQLKGWDIVTASDATASEAYAAEEFQAFYEQAGGVKLPIVHEAKGAKGHVFIGESEPMRQSGLGFSVDGYGPEDLRIVIRDDAIAIAGDRPRGTLYGVYTFLEDYMGVCFLTPDDTYVPAVGDWRVVGPVDRFYHPPFGYRWSASADTNRNVTYATRTRNNVITDEDKYGGRTSIGRGSHSFSRQIPTREYGKAHPEYFALRDGKRLSEVGNDGRDTQPCLTNPEVLKIVTQSVLEDLRAHPEKHFVIVGQNDNTFCCQCPACAALDAQEGGPMGSLLTFVNAVADAVAKERPDVTVGTLAYTYTRKPPKTVRPRPNVLIQLCSIECSEIFPMDDARSMNNPEFREDMVAWGKICSNISIWSYNTDFHNYLLPCPNLWIIGPNLRFFAAHNAKGAFMQGPGNAVIGGFSQLSNYMTSRLLWNPNLSSESLMDEFLTLHYGKATPPIRRWLNLLHEKAIAAGLKADQNCYADAAAYGIDEETAREGIKAFDEALALADSDVRRGRVEVASICAYRAAVGTLPFKLSTGRMRELNEGRWKVERISPEAAAKARPYMRKMLELCNKHGVTHWSESCPLPKAQEIMRECFGMTAGEAF